MNVQEVSLDISLRRGISPEVYLGQDDSNATTLIASVFDGAAAFDLSNYSVRFCMKLPDGIHYYSVAGTTSGNVATFEIDESYAGAVHGTTDVAYVEISDGDDLVASTSRMCVIVLRGAQAGATPGDQYISEIEEVVAESRAVVEEAEEAAESIVGIAEAEAARVQAEQSRVTAENARASAETARATAETSRSTAETARASAETSRASAEASRASAETSRASAETARENAQDANDAAQAQNNADQAKNNADQAKNNADQALNNQQATGLAVHICATGEYDPQTGLPTISGASSHTLYLVPTGSSDDEYNEFLYTNSKWNPIGKSTASIEPITTTQVDSVAADSAPTGSQVLNLTGLSYLWSKLKAAFAAVTHYHTWLGTASTTSLNVNVSYNGIEEGLSSVSGQLAHAEGDRSQAGNFAAHAEGRQCNASGTASHAEGIATMASGSYSHSQGNGTVASGNSQHAAGKYNVLDNNNTYAEVIGNGTANDARSNARTLDWNGNAWHAGEVSATEIVTGGTNVTHNLTDKAEQSDVADLQTAVGDVDVSQDGDLQTQVDELRDSVDKVSFSNNRVASVFFNRNNADAGASIGIVSSSGNSWTLWLDTQANCLKLEATINGTSYSKKVNLS